MKFKSTSLATLFITGLSFMAYSANVTFRVNMNGVNDTFTTPEVNGTFNNWCGNCWPMSDEDGDNIWEFVVDLEPGTYEFKFSNDNWAGQEELEPGTECTLTTETFTNRLLTVGEEDIVMEAYCWGTCSTECGDGGGTGGGSSNVTFQVDMNSYTGDFTTPEVNGTFNNWCGNCWPMSDANADGIWEFTVNMEADTFDYKFSVDNWAAQEELEEGMSCTAVTDGFINRTLIVSGNEDIVLDPVCWESCEQCATYISSLEKEIGFNMTPNPTNSVLRFTLNSTQEISIRIFDISGKEIESRNIISLNSELNTSLYAEGLYFVQVSNKNETFTKKFVVQH